MTGLSGKRLRRLTDLEVSEISLVDHGANEGARVVLWKRDVLPVEKQVNNLRTKLMNTLVKAIESLAREKGITRLAAMLEIFESAEGKKALEVLSTMKREKGRRMYTSVGEIAKAMESGEIESQEDALKVFDEFVESEVKKSDYSMEVSQARLMKMTGPGWDSYFNAFMNLPETVEEGQAIEKQQRVSDNVIKVIEDMAKELVQKDSGMTKEKAFMEVCRRHPELERLYRAQS